LECKDCHSTIIYPDGGDGEKICGRCGLVIDCTPSFQIYSQWTPDWHSNWSQEDSETIREWLTTLRAVSCQLNIPNFPYREEAARTIRRGKGEIFKSQKLSKNKRATVAGLIHLTLKEYNKMRPIKEISEELSLNYREVAKQTWLLKKILDQAQPLKIHRITAIDYLHEYAGNLTKNKEVTEQAEKTLNGIRRVGGNPVGLAAGAFYLACKQKKMKVSKEQIGSAFHISGRTVYMNESRIRKLKAKANLANLSN